MCGIHVLLIGTGIGLAALMGGYAGVGVGDAGDGVGDAGDGLGVTTASSYIAKDFLYMLNNFQLNSGDVRHSRYVDRDRYCAGGTPGWRWW